MPKARGCCGIPAISTGDTETFNRLVRCNLNLFDSEDFDYLVTSCATCTSTIKKNLADDALGQPGRCQSQGPKTV